VQLGFAVVRLSFDPIVEARRQWDERWGSDATPSMAAVTSIMRAQQILMARLNELLEPLDLTFPRYEAVMLLFYSREGELPLGKISDRLQVHRASVTNVIDKLVESGYVERVAHEPLGFAREYRSPDQLEQRAEDPSACAVREFPGPDHLDLASGVGRRGSELPAAARRSVDVGIGDDCLDCAGL